MRPAAEPERRSIEERDVRVRINSKLKYRNGHHLHLPGQLHFRTRRGGARRYGQSKRRDQALHARVWARGQNGRVARQRVAEGVWHERDLVARSSRPIQKLDSRNHWRSRRDRGDVRRRQLAVGRERGAHVRSELFHARFRAIKRRLAALVVAAQPLIGHHHPAHAHHNRGHQQQNQQSGD